jgi:hypothetical protein
MRHVAICCAALTLVGAAALAADPQLDTAQRCTRITDSLERLVCYDKAMAPVATPAAPARSAAPAPAVAPTAAASPPAAPVAAAMPELGQEQLKQSGGKTEDAKPTSLDAKVSSLDSLPWNMVRVTLENGQVWQQQESSVRFTVKVGDTVRIKKGALGSYRMARVSNGTSGWVQVRRVE